MAINASQQRNFIIEGFALHSLKTLVFSPPEFETDDPLKTSMLGTPVFGNLDIQGGSYVDLDGNTITYDGLTIDTVLFSVQQSKNVVTTPVQGRDGTVKEYISAQDFVINIDGILVGDQANVYPEEAVNTLIEIMNVPESINIVSEFLDRFDISEVVITDYDLSQQKGSRNIQLFRLSLLSDTPIELQ